MTIGDIIAVITAFGVTTTCEQEPFDDPLFALQAMDFTDGYRDETGELTDYATEVGNEWATFSASWDVYRLWVEVETSTTKVEAIYGDDIYSEVLALTTDGNFYNHASGTNLPPSVGNFGSQPKRAIDTFNTIGSATSGSGVTVSGTLNLATSVMEENTGWYKTGGVSPVAGGSTGWRVLVGQFAVPEGEPFAGGARIVGDGIDEYATFSSEE